MRTFNRSSGSPNRSRRTKIAAALGVVAAAAFVLTACTTQAPPKPTSTASVPASTDTEVTFAGPAGVYQTTFQNVIFPKFEKETGIKVNYVPGGADVNFAKVQAEVANPSIDVFWGTDLTALQGAGTALAPIDTSKLPNASRLTSDFPLKDGAAGVPIASLAIGLFYNKAIFDQQGWKPITDWKDLTKAEFKSRVGVNTLPSALGDAQLVQAAVLNGGSINNIDPGITWFQKLRSQMFAPPFQSTVFDSAIQQGNVALGIYHGARIQQLNTSSLPLVFVKPKSGTPVLTQMASITKNAHHPDAAYQLINYLLSDAVQKQLPGQMGYGPTTTSAIDKQYAEYVPSPTDKLTILDWKTVAKDASTWVDKWQKQVQP